MKIKLKYKLSFSETDKLIERYYDGLTSVEEEKQLTEFLSQPNLPAKYEPEQAIFGYFSQKKQKAHFSLKPYIRWISAAAVILSVVFGLQFLEAGNRGDYAYIDGKKITDIQEVKSQALASLSDIDSGSDEMEKSFKNLNNKDLIKDQLDIFSGL
jgi:hypothetical protein